MLSELIRQEVIKLFTRRYVYLLLALPPVLLAARLLAMHLSPPETTMDVPTSLQFWAEAMMWGLRLSGYVLLVLGAMSFSQEFSLGTVKAVLTLPVSRSGWYAAKGATLLGVAWLLLAVNALLAWGLTWLLVGWQGVTREGLVLLSGGQAFAQAALALGLTALLLAPLCAFALWLGLYFSSSGAAVGVAVLAGTVGELAAGLFGAGRYLFLSQLYRPLEVVERMGRGLSGRWEQVWLWGLAVGVVSLLVFGLWGWRRFERLDIHT